MTDDWFLDESTPRVGAARLGLGLTALALGALCLSDVLWFARHFFGFDELVKQFEGHPVWFWGVNALIPWSAVLGSLFLWVSWNDRSWQWRAGLLTLMNGFDAAAWTLTHAEELGLYLEHGLDLRWLHALSGGLGWLELMLAASLALSLAERIGQPLPADAGQGPRTLGILGLVLWGLPLLGGLRGPQAAGVIILMLLVQTILTFQVTLLCLNVARRCRGFEDAQRHQEEAGLDLLRPRSETEAD